MYPEIPQKVEAESAFLSFGKLWKIMAEKSGRPAGKALAQ
jgi:hypothetical protein